MGLQDNIHTHRVGLRYKTRYCCEYCNEYIDILEDHRGQLQCFLDFPSCMYGRISGVNTAIMTVSHEKEQGSDEEAGGYQTRAATAS